MSALVLQTWFFVGYFVEVNLNYEPNNVRKKIASKSLKAFLRGSRTVGKFTGNIVNKELVG